MTTHTANKKKANCLAKGIDITHIDFLNSGKVYCSCCKITLDKTAPTQIDRHIKTKAHLNKLDNPIIDMSNNIIEVEEKVEVENVELKVLPNKPNIKNSMDMDIIAKMVNHMSEEFVKQLLEKDNKIKELEEKIKDLEENDEIILNEPYKPVNINEIKKNIITSTEEYESEEEVIIAIDKEDKVYIEEQVSDIETDEEDDEEDDDEYEEEEEEEELTDEIFCSDLYDKIKKKNKDIKYHEKFSEKDILKIFQKGTNGKTILANFSNPNWVKIYNKDKNENIKWIRDMIEKNNKLIKELTASKHQHNAWKIDPQIEDLIQENNKLEIQI
jgi:hypothetical protein